MNRPKNKGLLIGFIVTLILSQQYMSPNHSLQPLIQRVVVNHIFKRGKYRSVWYSPRLEEAYDCIRRLPPPGNTRQTRITSFFGANKTPVRNIQCTEHGRRTNHTINVLQWNAQSLSEAKAQELTNLGVQSMIDVICISELGHRRRLPGYKAIAVSDVDTQAGIFCRAKLPVTKVPLLALGKFEEAGILTQTCIIDTAFILIHVYIAPRVSTNIRTHYWNALSKALEEFEDQPVMITGDLNTLSPEISENHEIGACIYFSSFLEETNFQVLNDSTPTRGSNTLDATICNEKFIQKVVNWQVLDELDSDHLPTFTQTSFRSTTNRLTKPQNTYRYLHIPGTVQKIKNMVLISNQWSSTHTLGDFHKVIMDNLTYRTSYKAGAAFWTPELTDLKRKRNKARRELRNAHETNQHQLKIQHKQAQKQFRKALKKAKRQFQNKAVEEISNSNNSRKVWDLTKSLIPGTRKRTKSWKSSTVHASKEVNSIANTFAQISSDPDISLPDEEHRSIMQEFQNVCGEVLDFKPVSKRELHSALYSANPNSASGADNISVKLLRAIAQEPELSKILQDLCTKVLASGEFPSELKIAKIRALPKQTSSQYRPISLLPTLGKLVDRMITTRLREQMLTKFHPSQQGCRSAHGTSSAIVRLLHHSGIAAEEGKEQHFGVITFDFSKAYDRVSRTKLMQKLMDLDIDPYLIRIINNWLQERKFFVDHRGSQSQTHILENGIPQGSALSVLLWLIYVNDIDLAPETSNIYVDDVIVWASGSTRREVINKLQKQASTVYDWSKNNRVKINFDKTHFLINDYMTPCSVLVGDHRLYNEKSIRYLGVDFLASPAGDNCSLGYDLKPASVNIRKRCAILKPMRRMGFTQHHISTVVQGFVLGKLRYYTPWLGADVGEYSQMLLDPLTKAYNQVMRVFCSAICTTPIALLHAGSRFPELETIIQRDCTRLVLSSVASNTLLGQEYLSWNGEGNGLSPLGCAWRTLINHVPESFTEIQDRTKPDSDTLDKLEQCVFTICEDKNEAKTRLNSHSLLQPQTDLEVWCDGSYSHTTHTGGTGVLICSRSDFITAVDDRAQQEEVVWAETSTSDIAANFEDTNLKLAEMDSTPLKTILTKFGTKNNPGPRQPVEHTAITLCSTKSNCTMHTHIGTDDLWDKCSSPADFGSETQISTRVMSKNAENSPGSCSHSETRHDILTPLCGNEVLHVRNCSNALEDFEKSSVGRDRLQKISLQAHSIVELDSRIEHSKLCGDEDHQDSDPPNACVCLEKPCEASAQAKKTKSAQKPNPIALGCDSECSQTLDIDDNSVHTIEIAFPTSPTAPEALSESHTHPQCVCTEPNFCTAKSNNAINLKFCGDDDNKSKPSNTNFQLARSRFEHLQVPDFDTPSGSCNGLNYNFHDLCLLHTLVMNTNNIPNDFCGDIPNMLATITSKPEMKVHRQCATLHTEYDLEDQNNLLNGCKLTRVTGSYLQNVTSSYDCEAEALLEGLRGIDQMSPSGQKISLYSDNRGLMTQLDGLRHVPKIVDATILEIIEILARLIELNNQVYITWIPGHCGVIGNEIADYVAKLSSQNPTWAPISDRCPRVANADFFLKEHMTRSLDTYLDAKVKPSSQKIYPDRSWFKGKEEKSGNATKTVYPYKTEQFDAVLFRARTGHTYCQDHLYRFGIIKRRSCRYCTEPKETVEHLALHCPHFDNVGPVRRARRMYRAETSPDADFGDLLWTDPHVVRPLLHAVRRHAPCL